MVVNAEAGSLPASTLAEVSAVVAILAATGAPAEATRSWEILLAFLPWYALETQRSIESLWALPAREVVGGICQRLPGLCTDRVRIESVNAELLRLIPMLQKGMGR
jgi:hypothetical protein